MILSLVTCFNNTNFTDAKATKISSEENGQQKLQPQSSFFSAKGVCFSFILFMFRRTETSSEQRKRPLTHETTRKKLKVCQTVYDLHKAEELIIGTENQLRYIESKVCLLSSFSFLPKPCKSMAKRERC